LVEQLAFNQLVVGSNPTRPTLIFFLYFLFLPQQVALMLDTIIFDLGGVLYDIDPQLSHVALAGYGLDFSTEQLLGANVDSPVDQFERGQLNIEQFTALLQQHANDGVSAAQLQVASCALLLGFTQARIDYLQRLASHYRLFLLSNTNPLHIQQVNCELAEKYAVESGLDQLFIKPYFSYEMGMRKPDEEIYQTVIAEQQLDPGRTLFIDDSKKNTAAAARCGLQVLHKPATQELCDALPCVLK
jgi:glucose-1-phosphatase